MKARAQRFIPALGNRDDGLFGRAAFASPEFQQVEKKPGSFLPAERQAEEEINEPDTDSQRGEAEGQPEQKLEGERDHGRYPPFPSMSIVVVSMRNNGANCPRIIVPSTKTDAGSAA